jgi:hypothetical protein
MEKKTRESGSPRPREFATGDRTLGDLHPLECARYSREESSPVSCGRIPALVAIRAGRAHGDG